MIIERLFVVADPGKIPDVLFAGMLSLVGILVAVTGIFVAEYHALAKVGPEAQAKYKPVLWFAVVVAIAAGAVAGALLVFVTSNALGNPPTETEAKLLAGGVGAIIVSLLALITYVVIRLK